MKHLPAIAGILLGLLFVMSGVVVLFELMPPEDPPPEGSPVAMFMGAMMPTGYMTFVKMLEITGGVLVAIPKLRNLGLLVLGPIILNILAFHVFIAKGGIFESPFMIPIMCALALYLLWVGRKEFAGLVR